jgi:capsular polysaccharide biosynthesis protein
MSRTGRTGRTVRRPPEPGDPTTRTARRLEQGDGIAAGLVRVQLRRFLSFRLVVTLVATFVVVSAVTALAFDRLQQPVYGAQADVIFQPSGDASDFRAQRDVGTQPLIVRGLAVMGPVSQSTGIPVDELDKMVSVDLLTQSNIVRITVADPDRATAERVAKAVTTQYLSHFATSDLTPGNPAATQLQKEVKFLSGTVSRLLDRLDRLSRGRPPGQRPGVEEQALQAASTVALQRLRNLQSELAALESRQFLEPDVSLLVAPHPLEGRLKPRPVQSLAVGMLVGLFAAAGVAVAALWPRRRDLLHAGGDGS